MSIFENYEELKGFGTKYNTFVFFFLFFNDHVSQLTV